MGISSILFVLALAALSPFLYERWQLFSTLHANAPDRLAKVNNLGSHQIKFSDRIRSCEDVLLLEAQGLALIACDPGRERWNTVMGIFRPGPVTSARLYAYDYQAAGIPDAEALKNIEFANFSAGADLHTLGMAYNPKTSTLYVINHAQAGSRIEMFKLDVGALVATHVGTIQHPLIHTPNALALLDDDEFYVTNDHFFTAGRSRMLSQLETFLAPPAATVVHVKLHGGQVEAKVVARMPYANGIEVINSTTVAVASTTRGAVYLYTATQSPATLQYHSQLRLPFLPDNLSLSGGKLMIAGHAHITSLFKFAKTRYICNDPEELAKATAEMKDYCPRAAATSWVSEWSEADGLKHLYVDTEYPTSATATKDAARGVGIIAGLYAKGILVWRE
ncbi:paraoxonase [Hirsutella rhossiliensis]|uniref:Paraoxonase n=1 Tax=Hirsutella rhossiliensis TaxID=111463 RepID=A0A9P8SMC2_9HYPO|nr:paraoxonase [Hirsutella rhossiliensis]KAH0967189.1 paraoxonase [Hirsutella rhossiliensis]